MTRCVRAAVDNAKATKFCLHKDINNDAATQRHLHFNHAAGYVPGAGANALALQDAGANPLALPAPPQQ